MICLFKSLFEVNFSQRHLTTNGEIAYCQKLMSTVNLDGRSKSKTQKGEFLAELLVQFLSVLIEPFFYRYTYSVLGVVMLTRQSLRLGLIPRYVCQFSQGRSDKFSLTKRKA